MPRAELGDVLWPQSLPGSGEGALRGVVSRVRGALGAAGLSPADVVTSAFGCYQLHLPPDTVVDVAVAAAEDAVTDGDPEEACQHAVVARRLAATPFLPEEGGEWVDGRRVELRNVLLRALFGVGSTEWGMDAAADAHLGRRRPDLAVEAAEAAIAAEPFREVAYRRLMAAYVAAGSRGEALPAYERKEGAICMHLDLDLFSAEDGRIKGSVGSNAGGERVTFSGWLELLRLLEAAVSAESSSPPGTCPRIP